MNEYQADLTAKDERDVRVITSLQGQSASDKATAARFNDWKGVDPPGSKVQSIPGRDAA